MLLSPRRTKFRKMRKGRIGGQVGNLKQASFGSFAFQACRGGRLTAACLEASRRVLSRTCKRSAQIWIRCFPDTVRTQKPLEVLMGKGKGSPSYWVAVVRPGQIVFEVAGATPAQVQKACHKVSVRLGLPIRVLANT